MLSGSDKDKVPVVEISPEVASGVASSLKVDLVEPVTLTREVARAPMSVVLFFKTSRTAVEPPAAASTVASTSSDCDAKNRSELVETSVILPRLDETFPIAEDTSPFRAASASIVGAAAAITFSTNVASMFTTLFAAALVAISVATALSASARISPLSPPPAADSASAIVLATATI